MAVRIAKEMYAEAGAKGLTLTEYLEKERPSEIEGLDAFEFALAEQEINLRRDTVEKFYRTVDDKVLFPEFINRQVRIGIMGLGKKDLTLADVVATETPIDAGVYETVKAVFDNKNLDFKKVTEGAAFPTVKMATGKQSITLAKIGLQLDATYEVLRRMKLPLLSIHMQLIGKRLAKKMVAYAVYVLLNGDGNANNADKTTKVLDYANLLEFDLDMDDYEATTWFSKKAMIQQLCLITEFKDTRLFDTARTGAWVTPFGNSMKKFNWKESTLGDDQIFAIDKSAALELVKESGAELVETDKVIDRQFEKTVISQVLGFSKIFAEACRVFQKAA
ncbi:MAG: phage major capsid protein [Desulfobacterales bacterium]|nr:phage major capsid protein [Desulfobacterales bacterium]